MPTIEHHSARDTHRGLRGFIERMFSGFVTSRGQVVAVVVSSRTASAAPTVAIVRRRESNTPADADLLATVTGPRVYPLPNSPTGWGESHHGIRASYGDPLHDPTRPDGLIADILGLSPDDERR
jgi:hypothetical protein